MIGETTGIFFFFEKKTRGKKTLDLPPNLDVFFVDTRSHVLLMLQSPCRGLVESKRIWKGSKKGKKRAEEEEEREFAHPFFFLN